MYENFLEIIDEIRSNLKALEMGDFERKEYQRELEKASALIARDKFLRENWTKIDAIARGQRFELLDLNATWKKKIQDVIDNPESGPRILLGHRHKAKELAEGVELMQDVQTEIDRELKKNGDELLKLMRTNSELKRRLSIQGEYEKVGRKFSLFGA